MDTETFTDSQWDTIDRIDVALTETGDLTPSQAARKAGTDSTTARHMLDWMVTRHMAHTSGNGARTHYHPGRIVQ